MFLSTEKILPKTMLAVSLLALSGCATALENVGLGVGLGTLYLARTPSNEIEQIYYLGTVDPQEQIPPTIYRIRVRGQASAINLTKFASGWVKAGLIDSLGTDIGFTKDRNGGLSQTVDAGVIGGNDLVNVASERRFVVFGPEGFREAPKDHRLVIVMGADPEAFFSALDEALGQIATTQTKTANDAVSRRLSETLIALNSEEERLKDLALDIEIDFKSGKEKP